MQRYNGVIYYFLNGVIVGSFADSNFYYDRIWFDFWENQQTYKYLDEFRFVNKALYGTSGYTPSSVPFDTNLTLVLPDSTKPVADEYWSWDTTITPAWSFDFTKSTIPSNYYSNSSPFGPTCIQNEGYLTLQNLKNDMSNFSVDDGQGPNSYGYKECTWTFLDRNGSYYSVTYHPGSGAGVAIYDWGRLATVGNVCTFYLDVGKTVDLVYGELTDGPVGNTGHEYITKIVPVTNYEKPTLAVRTDIPITGKQIGGARPSLPTKGLVWAMVESGVIRSLQIYNGTAWEACDGRIFTGTRWIPYSGYNIITLKDFYDVVDASGDSYEYIYTEAGFWNWWQKSWNAFTNKLFAALSSAGFDVDSGTGQSGSLWSRIKNAFNNSLGVLIESLFGLITDVLSALLSLVTDMLSFFFSFLTDATVTSIRAFFSAFSDDTLFDFFQQPPTVGPDGTETGGGYGLPSEVGTAFGFISGVIMVLPPDLRSILFFGLAVMVLLGVFKLVKT